MDTPSNPAPAFTPGPLKLQAHETATGKGAGLALLAPGGELVAFIPDETTPLRPTSAKALAWARFFEAAPEMYAALEGMVEFAKAAMGDLYDANELVADAIAALARARGEAEGGAR